MSPVDFIVYVHLTAEFLLLPAVAFEQKHKHWGWAIAYSLSYVAVFSLLTRDPRDLLLIGAARLLIGHFRLGSVWARLINWNWQDRQPIADRKIMYGITTTLQLLVDLFAIAW